MKKTEITNDYYLTKEPLKYEDWQQEKSISTFFILEKVIGISVLVNMMVNLNIQLVI